MDRLCGGVSEHASIQLDQNDMLLNELQLVSELACKLMLAVNFSLVNVVWWLVQQVKVQDEMCVYASNTISTPKLAHICWFLRAAKLSKNS